jgi:dUTP pyrophosphatase
MSIKSSDSNSMENNAPSTLFSSEIRVKYSDKRILPLVFTPGNVGIDIRTSEETFTLPNDGQSHILRTGVFIEMPDHLWCQINPRSGLALKGVDVRAGVIDSSYRGEIKVILANFGKENIEFNFGDRIAQLIFQRVEFVEFNNVEELEETERGENGFGSSGLQ